MRYQLIIAFDDHTCKSEFSDSLQQILGAVQIYLELPDLSDISIIDYDHRKLVMSWCRT